MMVQRFPKPCIVIEKVSFLKGKMFFEVKLTRKEVEPHGTDI